MKDGERMNAKRTKRNRILQHSDRLCTCLKLIQVIGACPTSTRARIFCKLDRRIFMTVTKYVESRNYNEHTIWRRRLEIIFY